MPILSGDSIFPDYSALKSDRLVVFSLASNGVT